MSELHSILIKPLDDDELPFGEHLVDQSPDLATAYKAVVTEVSPEHQKYLDDIIDVSKLDPVHRELLNEYFPHWDNAVWLYEGISTQSITITYFKFGFYRNHSILSYDLRTDTETISKKVLFKKARYMKGEWLMAEITKLLGTASYRVLPVETGEGSEAHWQYIPVGIQTILMGGDEYKEVVGKNVPIRIGNYSVVEWVEGETLFRLPRDFVDHCTPEQQQAAAFQFGLVHAADFLLAGDGVESFANNTIWNPATHTLTRIDREHNMRHFSEIPSLEFPTGHFKNHPDLLSYYHQGLQFVAATCRKNIDTIISLINQSALSGTAFHWDSINYESSQRVVEQLERLEAALDEIK